jgi:hypothetical protein
MGANGRQLQRRCSFRDQLQILSRRSACDFVLEPGAIFNLPLGEMCYRISSVLWSLWSHDGFGVNQMGRYPVLRDCGVYSHLSQEPVNIGEFVSG